jgi:hypothetical protein
MFKYTPINSYSLRNLHDSQIYFNNPLNFNDPFDTFHQYEVTKLSNAKFVELFCKSNKRDFNERHLLEILDKSISKSNLVEFCKEHFDYFFDLEMLSENQFYIDKADLLNQIENVDETKNEFIEIIGSLLFQIMSKINASIKKELNNIRLEKLSKIGVCCFSKNNTNLLMWAHYAESHKGMCLEFDPKYLPFFKAFNVEYELNIPALKSDLFFEREENSEFIQKLLSFKSIDWKDEEEMRILHQENNKSYYYPIQSLKAIYFGLKTNSSDIEMICSIIKSKTQDVKFYRMDYIEKKFGIEPKQFHYSTPQEVQSSLIFIITNQFNNNEFSVEELIKKEVIQISKTQLEIHLEELTRKNILIKQNLKYKLNKRY